jgi:ABC-type multidrug transport system fused ATPase/permease subunit
VIAVVGATGAGKSTMASLIPRLYDPSKGQVVIDGSDVREYTLESLRSQVSLVLQNTMLFHASIAENIAYGRPGATEGEIVAAAKAANAHGFIMELPEGYETVLGERGDTLSGGQRQRIAIARALVRDAPILILDEPTTGLDAKSEEQVLDALEALMKGRTTLLIAHKLSAVRRADQILVIEQGKVVEQGGHQALLDKNGRYAELYRIQMGTPIRAS